MHNKYNSKLIKNLRKLFLVLFCLPLSLRAQFDTMPSRKPVWRTLTITNVTGLDKNNRLLNLSSLNLYYEIERGIAITNWTGIQSQTASMPGWISSQTLLVKSTKGFTYGAGIQYGNSAPSLVPIDPSMFGVVSLSYRFKLK
jgi:hypothetical protein